MSEVTYLVTATLLSYVVAAAVLSNADEQYHASSITDAEVRAHYESLSPVSKTCIQKIAQEIQQDEQSREDDALRLIAPELSNVEAFDFLRMAVQPTDAVTQNFDQRDVNDLL